MVSLNLRVFGADYTEVGDAGQLPASAQAASGPVGGSLTGIVGSIGVTNNVSEVDMYRIYISDPTAFSASTTGFTAGKNLFDTQLFLFNSAGLGVFANDDASTGGFQSLLPSGSSFSFSIGTYFLLIDGGGRFPVDSLNRLIFPNYTDQTTNSSALVGPTGPGGANAIAGYTGNSSEGGNYRIALTGTQFDAVPEPSSVALIVSMLVIIGGMRNSRARRLLVISFLLAVPCGSQLLAATGLTVKARIAAAPGNLNRGLRDLTGTYQSQVAYLKRRPKLSEAEFQRLLRSFPRARGDTENRVIADVYLDGNATLDQVALQLEALGCTVKSRIDFYMHGAMSVWLPLGAAADAGRLNGVECINLARRPKHNVGKVTSEGAFVQKVEALTGTTATTTQMGKFGAGIKVGVLSDSFNMLKTTGTGSTASPLYANVKETQDKASFDLPGNAGHPYGNTTAVEVQKDFPSSDNVEDEGRAMLQIIHDLAPQAKLAFYTADESEVDFAAGILQLATGKRADGTSTYTPCNVICDDVGYYDEAMFSDGPVAQAIDQAAAAGVAYFSSAGNDDSGGYVGTFTPVTNNSTAQGYLTTQGANYSQIANTEKSVITAFHAFGFQSDGTPILVQTIRIPGVTGNGTGILVFQWDDPYLSLSATNNVTTDFDILVFSSTGGILTTRSGTQDNYASKFPLEIPYFDNSTSQVSAPPLAAGVTYKIVIARTNRAAASATPNLATHLRYTIDTSDTPVRGDYITAASSNTRGHPDAAGCIGTAAYFYDASPVKDVHTAGHTVQPIAEQFSSNGPVTKYFDSAGNRLATPVTRKQPVLSATDGVSTSFFPPDSVTSGTTPPTAPGPSNPSPYDYDGDGYPNFSGTSAAAPHAAAIAAIILGVAKENNITLTPADVRTLLITTTQSPNDQTANSSVATAGATTVTAGGYGRTDNNAFTVAYNGAAGTTLTQLKLDLSPVGIHFDTGSSVAIPTDASATATSTGVVVSSFNGKTPVGNGPNVSSFTVAGSGGTANSLLTVNFTNFNPGSTLKFGVGRRNDGTNFFGVSADPLGGRTAASPAATITATTSVPTTDTGTFTNSFYNKWNYKTGYGLIDAQAAVNKLLGN